MSEQKMVPREPTPAMSAKGFAVYDGEDNPAGVWQAMYDAAPTQAAPGSWRDSGWSIFPIIAVVLVVYLVLKELYHG